MSPKHNAKTASNPSLSQRRLQPAITQVFIADLFVEYNERYEQNDAYYGYCASTKHWHVCRDTYCTQWEHAVWSDPDASDITPLIYHDLIEILRPLVDTLPHTEQRRVMSHGFIAGVVRLLQNDHRMRVTEWDLQGTVPPVAERMEEERVAKL